MKISDFQIGLRFFDSVGDWLCTDVGTRTIAAICTRDGLPPAWYAGPPYPVEETLFDENAMKLCYIDLRSEIERRCQDKSHPGYEAKHVFKMMGERHRMLVLKRPYPRSRHAVFNIDRIGPEDRLLHPFSAKRRKGYWAIQYFEPYTEEYGEMPENDWVSLPLA